MAFPQKSLLIVGGGIVGLCLGVAAGSRGFETVLIRRDAPADTASGVAAGMIAPALEARNDPHPDAFARLKAAQSAWLDLMTVWPAEVQAALTRQQAEARSHYIDPDGSVTRVSGDWLLDGAVTLQALEGAFLARGGTLVVGEASAVSAHDVVLADDRKWSAAHVVIAAGYGSKAFAGMVPSLDVLSPIKGHLLDLPSQGAPGVTRSPGGYFADYGGNAKFGASMEPGRADAAIEPAVVAELAARAQAMFPHLPLDAARPRAAIRAATPDAWPLIGLDPTSGVWVATGMRRNGFVFAPYAASVILDRLGGKARPDADIYDPARFDPNFRTL